MRRESTQKERTKGTDGEDTHGKEVYTERIYTERRYIRRGVKHRDGLLTEMRYIQRGRNRETHSKEEAQVHAEKKVNMEERYTQRQGAY